MRNLIPITIRVLRVEILEPASQSRFSSSKQYMLFSEIAPPLLAFFLFLLEVALSKRYNPQSEIPRTSGVVFIYIPPHSCCGISLPPPPSFPEGFSLSVITCARLLAGPRTQQPGLLVATIFRSDLYFWDLAEFRFPVGYLLFEPKPPDGSFRALSLAGNPPVCM